MHDAFTPRPLYQIPFLCIHSNSFFSCSKYQRRDQEVNLKHDYLALCFSAENGVMGTGPGPRQKQKGALLSSNN